MKSKSLPPSSSPRVPASLPPQAPRCRHRRELAPHQICPQWGRIHLWPPSPSTPASGQRSQPLPGDAHTHPTTPRPRPTTPPAQPSLPPPIPRRQHACFPAARRRPASAPPDPAKRARIWTGVSAAAGPIRRHHSAPPPSATPPDPAGRVRIRTVCHRRCPTISMGRRARTGRSPVAAVPAAARLCRHPLRWRRGREGGGRRKKTAAVSPVGRAKREPLGVLRSFLSWNLFQGIIPGSLLAPPHLKVLDLSDNTLIEGVFPVPPEPVSLEVFRLCNTAVSGTLPVSAFKNLKNLQKLDLNKMDSNFDGLHGSLPASLFSLTHLKFLDLSGHYFEGSIPINLSSIPVSLEVLKLNHNLLNGTLPTEQALENLKNLQELNLSSNQFTGNIPRSLFSLPHIELLDLSGNLFQGPIPLSSSSNLPVSLKSLRFSHNNLSSEFSFFWLRNLTKLEEVSLSGNDNLVVDVNIPGWEPPFQLKQLELSDCDLDKNIITEPHFLRTQHHLEVLDLSNNNLSGSIPNWLFTKRARIYWLYLRNNSLTGSLQSIWHPQNFLEYINVSMNRVADPLPENISSIFPNLVFLDFSNNKIHGHIPMELCQIRRLRHLDLSNNKISGEVPACLFTGHTELMTLKVSKNKLGGPIFGGMDNLSLSFALWYLSLDSNKYEGSMPQNMSAQNLLLMDLHDNKLSGKLHTSFWKLPSLMALNLADSTLTGEIHPSFCNLTSIVVLDLSNNNLTGSIPNCSRTKQQLYFLNLSNNSLSGDISYAFFNISNLIAMDIRHNQFTGNLSWVYSLKINILSLGGNNFEGQISPDICNLQFLRIIDFSHNKLSGSVPACIGNILFNNVEDGNDRIFLNRFRLADIEMHDSDLSTTYYDLGFAFYTKWYQYAYGFNFVTMMSGIDLSANMLDGEIPWQLGNLSHIKSLNLSYNFFTGQIPATFADMKEIESLDLSHNNLSGPTPWQLTQLSSLGAFSVAYNNLSGCIPNYGQLDSFSTGSYVGNNNLYNTSQGSRCSPSGHVSKKEDMEERYDDPVLYIVSAASFVLAFCATVALSFCHSFGRFVILKM